MSAERRPAYFALLPVSKVSRFRWYDYFIIEVVGEIGDEIIFRHIGDDSDGVVIMQRGEVVPLTACQCRKLRKPQVANWPSRQSGGMKRIIKLLTNQTTLSQ